MYDTDLRLPYHPPISKGPVVAVGLCLEITGTFPSQSSVNKPKHCLQPQLVGAKVYSLLGDFSLLSMLFLHLKQYFYHHSCRTIRLRFVCVRAVTICQFLPSEFPGHSLQGCPSLCSQFLSEPPNIPFFKVLKLQYLEPHYFI